MNSTSVENFLKNVFTLQYDEGEKASASKLSLRLGISGPAITDMAKKLSSKSLINYQPYKEIELTEKGKEIAITVIRRHRLWEMFLHQVLNMDLSEVHTEAECLEHQTSDRLLARLDDFLGNPKFDPHGDPIPHADGTIQRHKNSVKMDQLQEGDSAKIVRLIYADEEIERLYDHYEIRTNKQFSVKKIFALDQSMEIQMDDQKILISPTLQKRIFCTVLK
ncbi:iron (metal) dependent repressor, DtxR family [Saccharicrinis carchari]|uniref:Transcriptional regulator MntR n=1 Tax=Saccharicrinis carchari TaxID=1168039 RepID=A0A521DXP7_SACCC|nr:metal-dependent transcriptional regulator [Saccharicrinis carchari]SMO76456.1 iron (metal) dependent repressor, DtxR family [Saccharicrinis carchari]